MLDTAIAQMRLGLSLAFGTPMHVPSFERVVAAMRRTIDEFGAVDPAAAEMVSAPPLDPTTRRLVQLRRFRAQAGLAARETTYYGDLFRRLGLRPDRLQFDDISRIPLTTKDHLRAGPDAFLRHSGTPWLRAMTSGTTGTPASVFFSPDEVRLIAAITASHVLLRQNVLLDDVAQVCLSSRAVIAVASVAGTCAHIGIPCQQVGLVEPALALALLSERRSIPGKRDRVSVMDVYPSYLGELVEHGLRAGLGPEDFGLRHIVVGGEILTEGMQARARRLFGPVTFQETYAMTETLPMGAIECSAGHWHFEASAGMLELLSLDGAPDVAPGEPATMVGTPFPPYRDTTLLVRYDTEDVVQPLHDVDCEMRDFPATTRMLGKRRLAVRHAGGWTFTRPIQEALEALDVVPLPARFGFWSLAGGVEVEAVARTTDSATHRAIVDALEAQGVPLRRLTVVSDRAHLTRPAVLRCDLREQTFVARAERPASAAANGAVREGGHRS